MMHLFELVLFIFSFLPTPNLEVSDVFSDHMVLQAKADIPVWGWGTPGEEVNISLGPQNRRAKTTEEGSWRVVFSPYDYGGDYELIVQGKNSKLHFEHITFGDVWICAGQSNMRFELSRSKGGLEAVRKAGDTDIRHLKVTERHADKPLTKSETAGWQVANESTAGEFSAVGYYFARELQEDLNYAMGLINITRGGSRIETWMSQHVYPENYVKEHLDSIKSLEARQRDSLIRSLGYAIETSDEKEFRNSLWSTATLSDAWSFQNLPGRWEDKGYPFLDGTAYYLRDFDIENISQWQKQAKLCLPAIDDADSVWINGELVGHGNSWNQPRSYVFDSQRLKKKENRILIKVMDGRGSGGLRGAKAVMALTSGQERIDLSGKWKFRITELKYAGEWRPRYGPTLFFNAMVKPLLNLPFKGVIWYQGENNARTVADARAYEFQFQQLIKDWRKQFGQGDFPFLFVQLPGHEAVNIETNAWPTLRWSQRQALGLPRTGMAVTIDLGEREDIHPIRKREVGNRLASLAQKMVYSSDKSIESYFEAEQANKTKGDTLIIRFTGAEFMTSSNTTLSGFELGKANGSFYKAQAKLGKGNTLKLWSDTPGPFNQVRYAWENFPEVSFIYNQHQIPLSTFILKIDHD